MCVAMYLFSFLILGGKKTKEETKPLCGTQTRIIMSGVAVLALVSVGVIFGASYSSRKNHKNPVLDDVKSCSGTDEPLKIRLPKNVIPLKYRLYMHPNITNGKFDYTGNVQILVDVKATTDEIVLHSKNLNIVSAMVYVAGKSDDLGPADDLKEIPLARKQWHCDQFEQLIIKLNEKLTAGGRFVVHIGFSAVLATVLEGFYKSSYVTKAGERRYVDFVEYCSNSILVKTL